MDVEFTKVFPFSASYASAERSLGRNFKLWITVHAMDEAREREFEAIVERELISEVRSRDLSQHVEFLKNVEIDDLALLRAFWARLSVPLRGFGTKRLALERDARTVTTLLI